MGVAIDTVLGGVNTGGTVTTATALTDVTIANGDSSTVRAFSSSGKARIVGVTLMAGTAGNTARIKSPMLHDNVRGLSWITQENPSVFLTPPDTGQPLVSNDTLEIQATAAASTATMIAVHNHYTDLPGAAARLKMWSDVSPNIQNIKVIEVDVTTGAASNAWVDTAINTTEDLLHANTDYALLGYTSDVNLGLVGIKGQETGNLRICGPGSNSTRDLSDYFVFMSQRHQLPYIPVFNSANKQSTFCSVASNVLSTAAKVSLIVAEMVNNFPT